MYIFFFFIPVPFLDSSFSMNSGVCQALSLGVGWGSLICSFIQQRFCDQCGEWDRVRLAEKWVIVLPSFLHKVPQRCSRVREAGYKSRFVTPLGTLREALDSSVWVSFCHSSCIFCVCIVTPPPIFFSLWNACSLMFLSFHFSVRQLSFPSKDTIPMLIILHNSPDFFLSFKPKYQLLSFVCTIVT